MPLISPSPLAPVRGSWHCRAIEAIEADFHRSADTHLIRLDLPALDSVRIYLKDESTHPSGSLKHRLARSLFLYGLCNSWIVEGRPVIEASSGSTAVSEAYFARLIGVPFIALVPETTAKAKVEAIEFQGGEVRKLPGCADIPRCCADLARELCGVFLDQFTNAERATDWRGNNNIAESLFSQMEKEPDPIPDWVVVGAGTGGTSATIGRYIRYRSPLAAKTRLCVVDPEDSALYRCYRDENPLAEGSASAVVEGIGRPRAPASFLPQLIDRMISIPDAASVAAVVWLECVLGRRCGPSTGANMLGALQLAEEMRRAGRSGSIVSLICDGGERYGDTIYAPTWRKAQGLRIEDTLADLERFGASGVLRLQFEAYEWR